jgi:hypothetical protein
MFIPLHFVANRRGVAKPAGINASHLDMDDAFCTRMREAIAAGLENATIGVVTTPGTKNPKYLVTEPRPLASSQRAMEYA